MLIIEWSTRGVKWRIHARCTLGVPTSPKQCARTKFQNTSTDPYFGAGEKGVMLPKSKTIELANT